MTDDDTLYADRAPFTIGLRFTADVMVPDEPCANGDTHLCTCSDHYGDPCEHGYGHTVMSGWCDPSWSPFVVDEYTGNRPEPEGFSYIDPDEDEDPIVNLWAAITRVICPDDVSVGRTLRVYPADPIDDYRTGEQSMVAAHVYGLSAPEADRLAGMLRGKWRP